MMVRAATIAACHSFVPWSCWFGGNHILIFRTTLLFLKKELISIRNLHCFGRIVRSVFLLSFQPLIQFESESLAIGRVLFPSCSQNRSGGCHLFFMLRYRSRFVSISSAVRIVSKRKELSCRSTLLELLPNTHPIVFCQMSFVWRAPDVDIRLLCGIFTLPAEAGMVSSSLYRSKKCMSLV